MARPQMILTIAFLLVSAACGPDRATQERLAMLEAVSAEKDSLLTLVAENARTMSAIGELLAGVESVDGTGGLQVSSESPLAAARDSLVGRVRLVTERVEQAEARLAQSRSRIRALTGESDSLTRSVQDLQASLSMFQEAMDAQRATVNELNERVASLTAENARLAEERQQLADSVTHLADATNTIYYVVGTEDELINRGIVHREGGARFLFVFGRRGQTLVPARDLDLSQFIAADRRSLTEIPLPDSTSEYRVASRQDLSALGTPITDGRVMGVDVLRIADPDRFWSASRYLIVVRRT